MTCGSTLGARQSEISGRSYAVSPAAAIREALFAVKICYLSGG
jgi:hypothetical protein